MRARLIENAVLVFAEKGTDASVIDDVVEAANVSRGTFYNYFPSNAELAVAVSEELANELMILIEDCVEDIEDPVERIATGLYLFLETVKTFPVTARFMSQSGLGIAGPESLIYEFLPPHIERAVGEGRFPAMPITITLDFIAGTVTAAVFRASLGVDLADHTRLVVVSILQGLGLPQAEASRISDRPLPCLEIPETSLLNRAERRFQKREADKKLTAS